MPSGLTFHHQETKQSGKDKIMTVGITALMFSIFFVDLVRMLHSSFGVYMIQMTKCSQEDKAWLIVVVYSSPLFLLLCYYSEGHCSFNSCHDRSHIDASIPFETYSLWVEKLLSSWKYIVKTGFYSLYRDFRQMRILFETGRK